MSVLDLVIAVLSSQAASAVLLFMFQEPLKAWLAKAVEQRKAELQLATDLQRQRTAALVKDFGLLLEWEQVIREDCLEFPSTDPLLYEKLDPSTICGVFWDSAASGRLRALDGVRGSFDRDRLLLGDDNYELGLSYEAQVRACIDAMLVNDTQATDRHDAELKRLRAIMQKRLPSM